MDSLKIQTMTNVFTLQLGAFVALSGVLVYLSRKPLRSKAAHGFTRFFAWEAILGLIVWNAPVWHDDMFSARQLVSWGLLLISPVIAILGVRALKSAGQSGDLRQDKALYEFEKTGQVVSSSIFALIRHPMYAALIFLAWGVYLKGVNPWTTGLVVVASLAMWMTAKRDEAECLVYFGEAYADYMKSTKRFIPYVV